MSDNNEGLVQVIASAIPCIHITDDNVRQALARDIAEWIARHRSDNTDEWRSIESAPKDGSLCLFYSPGNPKAHNEDARGVLIRTDRRHKDYAWGYPHEYPEAPYTHWMPLPEPPAKHKERQP